MPHDPYKALYIHIPFCASRCFYCDFHTKATPSTSRNIDKYFDFLVSEIRKASKAGDLSGVETVYIGGGTPTHVSSSNLTKLMYTLGVSMKLTNDSEVTIEANPESLNERLVCDLYALGVNRISIGVQSFNDSLLTTAGRIHNSEQAVQAIKCARMRFDNVNVDLMCGLPSQTKEDVAESVRMAIDSGVSHVSIYPLTIEKNTKFYRKFLRGKLELPSEDDVCDMMLCADNILKGAGFEHYEIANYAKAGFQCRHNIAYWTSLPYLGIGDSAATMTQNCERRMRVVDGMVTDDLDPAQMLAENLMLAMRMKRGVSDDEIENASSLLPGAKQLFIELEECGFVQHIDQRWTPTQKGWLLGNEMYVKILDLSTF